MLNQSLRRVTLSVVGPLSSETFMRAIAATLIAGILGLASPAQAQDWLADLRAHDRFLEDVWGG